jgi:glycosyltransferase involved in cell wall biosynthesis
MRLAYFAPLPPKRTGVADYAAHLARTLAPHADITFYDSAPGTSPVSNAKVVDPLARPETLLDLPRYNCVLYQLGNNPEFHGPILAALQACPAPVILHDAVLYFLIAGLTQGGMLREFLYNYGPDRLGDFFAIERDSPQGQVLRYPHPQKYPLLRRVLAVAPTVIVHSRTSAALLQDQGYGGRIAVIPHLAYPPMATPIDPGARKQTRESLGLDEGELLIGCFGFIAPTKRFPVLFAALARLRERLRFKLLIVGEGADIGSEIAGSGISDLIIRPGFVDDARFGELLRSIDLLVNLRFPSMGETSGPQIQAMACGLPSIVSDHGWFAELPDDAVRKIPVDDAEDEHLTEALEELGRDAGRRAAIGRAARAYSMDNCAPDRVARQFIEILSSSGPVSQEFYPTPATADAP